MTIVANRISSREYLESLTRGLDEISLFEFLEIFEFLSIELFDPQIFHLYMYIYLLLIRKKKTISPSSIR